MATYKQVSKGNWQVVVSLGFDDNGKRLRIKKQGFKRKADAEQFAANVLDKKNKGFLENDDSNVLFKDFIIKWFNEYKINTIAITTRDNYLSRIKTHIIPKLGSYKLNKITNITIQNFYNELINEGLKPSTAIKMMQILNSCFKYAKKNKLIYSIPTDIEKIKIEQPDIEFWNKQQIEFFLNEIKDTYLYLPILFEVFTGLRIGELCGVRWCDLDLEENTLTVRNQVIQNKQTRELIFTNKLKTKTSYRRISLPKILVDYLKELKSIRSPLTTDFVILDRRKRMSNPRNISMEFTRIARRYKYTVEEMIKKNKEINNYMQLPQITFHGLRHTHATLLIFNGENIKVVSNRLGHKDISTTLNTYTHLMDEMKFNTALLLDSIFEYKKGHQGDNSPKNDKKNDITK